MPQSSEENLRTVKVIVPSGMESQLILYNFSKRLLVRGFVNFYPSNLNLGLSVELALQRYQGWAWLRRLQLFGLAPAKGGFFGRR